jgi:anti-sigma regulatory factor (Ser/Thr protein kinase)
VGRLEPSFLGGEATVRLDFPPEPRLLSTVRLVVGMVARNAGIDEESIEDLKVAVSETCAVAVGDLTRAGLDAPIELEISAAGDRFCIEVRDRAPDEGRRRPAGDALDPLDDLDDRQFGLALVGALVDNLDAGTLEGGGHRTSFWLRRRPDAARS